MYWWDRAAELLTRKKTPLKRFGLVTTNSISQILQRRVMEKHLTAKNSISLIFAIADHPWTKATKDSAAVRIAMTVGEAGKKEGKLLVVVEEADLASDNPALFFRTILGTVNSDLTVGTSTSNVEPLLANSGVAHKGMQLNGQGFVLNQSEFDYLKTQDGESLHRIVRPYVNGRDLSQKNQNRFALDTFGLTEEELRKAYPHAYVRLLELVKPERDGGNEPSRKKYWWLHGRTHENQRHDISDFGRYIATTRTARHRIFLMLYRSTLAESKIILIASSDLSLLALLSSRTHLIFCNCPPPILM